MHRRLRRLDRSLGKSTFPASACVILTAAPQFGKIRMETAHVVRKSCKYHVQETYFVWSLVSEIYGKEKGGEVTHYFLARTRDLLAVGISKSKFV